MLSDEHKRSKYDMSGVMDLDDFDVEQFMNIVKVSGHSGSLGPSVDPCGLVNRMHEQLMLTMRLEQGSH